jgi:WD40 repeat protein
VRVVAYSTDGKTVLTGSEDRTIIQWTAETGERIRTFNGHNGSVFALAYSPDSQTFASGADDSTVLLWDLDSGAILRRFEGHRGQIRTVQFSPDGRILASASGDATVRLWRIDTLDELLAWAKAHRYIPPLSCDQQQLYKLNLECEKVSAAPDS